MRTLILFSCLLLATSVAMAEPQPGDFGAFADAEGTITSRASEPFRVEEFYLVAFDLPGGIHGYEFSFSGVSEIGGVITSVDIIGNGHPLCESDTGEFVCTTGYCIDDPGPLVILAGTYFFLEPVPADTAICPEGVTPSSFGSGRPGWLDCLGTVHEFGVATDGGEHYLDGCMILNPTQSPPVAVDIVSYGALKARF